MAVSSRKSSGPVMRSLSPSGRFCRSYSSSSSSSSSAFASSTSSFSTENPTSFFRRSLSPSRVHLQGSSSSTSASSVRFALDRSISPNRHISVLTRGGGNQVVKRQSNQKRTCLCSPTTHPVKGVERISVRDRAGFRSCRKPMICDGKFGSTEVMDLSAGIQSWRRSMGIESGCLFSNTCVCYFVRRTRLLPSAVASVHGGREIEAGNLRIHACRTPFCRSDDFLKMHLKVET
ncbi:hypothetical protein SDJN03_15230, partial [Cucurbita argyrosperma subsp. sororia]